MHRKRVKTVTEHHFRPFFGHWRNVDFHSFWTVLTLFGLGDFAHLQEWLILPLQILKDFWPKKKVVRMSWEARNNSEMGVAVSMAHVLDVFESFFFFLVDRVFRGLGGLGWPDGLRRLSGRVWRVGLVAAFGGQNGRSACQVRENTRMKAETLTGECPVMFSTGFWRVDFSRFSAFFGASVILSISRSG